ncbi:MAG: hypothetical protein U1F58_08375 [Burkholderiales bacterium]
MGILIAFPWGAFVIGATFALLWRWRRARAAAAAAVLWAAYGVYEYLMHARILCTGECNIRVDLLLVCPVLLAVSLAAVWATVRARPAR